MAKSSIS